MKRRESDVDIYKNSRGVICQVGFSSKDEPVWVIRNAYQRNAFTVLWAGNRSNGCPRQFLDKDNVKVIVDFENQIDNKVILLDILWKKLQVFQNYIVLAFTVKQIEFLLVSQSLVYFLVCHFLLNWYLQKGHLFELAWWLPLQLIYLNI